MSNPALSASPFLAASFRRFTPKRVGRVFRQPALRPEHWHGLALALAYYAGARVGFALQAPNAPQSVLWLPNSVLLAALLLSHPARWPMLLAAAFPAQLLVAWNLGEPLATMSLLFLTNCADALLGATVVRALTRGQWELTTLRSFIVFLTTGAVLGPLLVSFLDAAIATGTGWTASYWTAYTTRFFANTLTNVIVVPAIVGTVAMGLPSRTSTRYLLESAAVLAALAAVTWLVFARPSVDGPGPGAYLPVPLLLWAAVRLGPGMTGWAFLVVAFVASRSALHGIGAFHGADPEHRILALQALLFCVSLPVLCLAVVVREREAAVLELIHSRNTIRTGADTVRDLAGRLIANQEAERAHVARELHDGIGQYVADVAITMSAMRRTSAARQAGLDDDFRRLYEQTSLLFETIRAVTHRLHPSIIRHAGLLPAMHELCDSFERQLGHPVRFEGRVDRAPAENVALGVYRMAQEALNNVAAHAAASHASVTLTGDALGITLDVWDDGRGFDVVAAHARRGLGLVSIEERARALRGHIQIESAPGSTRLTVFVPTGI
jgi:signal transduction histidine kinase